MAKRFQGVTQEGEAFTFEAESEEAALQNERLGETSGVRQLEDLQPEGAEAETDQKEQQRKEQAAASTDAVRKRLEDAGKTPGDVPEGMTREDFERRIQPTGGAPERPDRTELFGDLRAEEGVENLEDRITQLRTRRQELADEFQRFTDDAGGAITTGVARGRISEEQEAVQAEMNRLRREEQLATDQLNLKNDYIETVLNLTDKDFSDARSEYEFEFSKNLQIQSSFASQQSREQQQAATTLSTITSLMEENGVQFDSLDPVMQNRIESLEIQAGMPRGTMQSFANNFPSVKPISTSSYTTPGNRKATDILYQDDNGEFRVTTVTGGPVRDTQESQSASIASQQLSLMIGEGGFVDINDYLRVRSISSIGPDNFDNKFAIRFLSDSDREILQSVKEGGDIPSNEDIVEGDGE